MGAGVPVAATVKVAPPPAVMVCASSGCVMAGGAEFTVSVVLAVALGLMPLLTVRPTAAPSHWNDTLVSDSEAPPLLVEEMTEQVPMVMEPVPSAVPLSVHA